MGKRELANLINLTHRLINLHKTRNHAHLETRLGCSPAKPLARVASSSKCPSPPWYQGPDILILQEPCPGVCTMVFIAHKYIPAHYSFSCPLRKGCTSSDSRAPPQHFQVFFQPTCWWSSWPRAFLTVCIVLTGAHVKVKLSSALGTSCLFPGGSDLSSVPTPLSPLVWAQQSPTDWQVKKQVVCLRIGNCRLMKFYL